MNIKKQIKNNKFNRRENLSHKILKPMHPLKNLGHSQVKYLVEEEQLLTIKLDKPLDPDKLLIKSLVSVTRLFRYAY